MEQILKTIKKDLSEIAKKENFKVKHIKNNYQDILEYSYFFTMNRKKHFINFRFIFQKAEESLSFVYHYEFNNKDKTISNTHSLANYQIDSLPGISDSSKERLNSVYKYEIIENKIKNTIQIENQYNIILAVFKKDYNAILKYVKNLSN